MASLLINDNDIPHLHDKVALITGGSSGIGFATAHLLASKGCRVYMLDLNTPTDPSPPNSIFVECDTSSWSSVLSAFEGIERCDIAVANAGVSENPAFFEDRYDDDGNLVDGTYEPIEVNLMGTFKFVKCAVSYMRRQWKERGEGGSIVITASATAYAPEQSLPVYGASKAALLGLVRALRSTLPRDDISINAVAPAATITKLLPQDLATPLIAAGLPVSSPLCVAKAVVYSATAKQDARVEDYGKDESGTGAGKWNGRCILTLGEEYTEIEGELSRLKGGWFGEKNGKLTRMQQAATDFRKVRRERNGTLEKGINGSSY